jgi:outer membrane protein OmpA-like peptidoglycan-associated protein
VVELELGAVVFAPGSREILPKFQPVIEQMADQLRSHDGGEVSIQTVSGEEALALDRAVRVREALLALLGDDAPAGLRIDVLEPDQSRLASVGDTLEIGTLLFDTDSDAIRAGSEPLLDAIARAVADAACGCGEIVITGRADVRGDDDYNQALSLRRAEAVRKAIEARMTPAQRTRLRVVTEGAAAPGAGP